MILRSLCKSGQVFIDGNQDQMRSFCFNEEVEKFALVFGENSCFFSRPVAHSIINELEFVYISNDLHKIEEFSKESHLLRTLSVGNRNFKLFTAAKVE